MTWELDPEPWDTLVLGADNMPGTWVVESDGIKRELKISKAKGEDGLSIRDEGMTAPRVSCQGQILSEEFERLKAILKTITPLKVGGVRTPLTIVHPIPNTLGIDKIYIDGISIKQPTSSSPMVCTLECIQWFPAPKKVKTKQAIESSEPFGPPTAPWGVKSPLAHINPPLSITPGDSSVQDALRSGPDLPL